MKDIESQVEEELTLLAETTTIRWNPNSFSGSVPLYKSNFIQTEGWDFIGCVVDIQLKDESGFFWVKYVGSLEGVEKDNGETFTAGDASIYHFGISKSGLEEKIIFRDINIHDIRNHYNPALEAGLREAESTYQTKSLKEEDLGRKKNIFTCCV